MQTVIYARYSSQLQNARSVEDQVSLCRERADREGWTIVDVFADRAISGAAGIDDAQRPGLNALLERVEAGGIDQVLTESTDRMARHQGDAFTIRERLDFVGCRLFTLIDGVVDDITGTIKGLMDARFRKDLGARIKRGQRGSVQQGRAAAGIAYGYKRANRLDERGDLIRGLREIDEDQAAIVRRIFAEYVAGLSPQTIAENLNRDGVPGPRGSGWAETTIRGDRKRQNGMINNRLYVGELVINRTSKIVNPRTRKTIIRPNPESEWIVHPAPDLRIIDQAVWDATVARLTDALYVPRHAQRRPKHMLSGLGRCAVCDGNWIRIDAEYWGCGRHRDGRRCANGRKIGTKRYEAEVLQHLQTQLLDPDLVAAYVREYHREYARRSTETVRERATLERHAGEAARKIERLVDVIAKGGEFEEIAAALAKARADRDRCTAQLARIAALPVVMLHPGLADEYRREITALGDALQQNEAARLEAIPRLRALIDSITLTPREGTRGIEVSVVGRLDAILGLAQPAEMQRAINRG